MSNLKRIFVWIDLEMTGLDVQKDHILEIATIITDDQLNIIAQTPAFIIHQPDYVLESMSEWVKNAHGKSGLTEQVRQSKTTYTQAEAQTLALIKEHCKQYQGLLAGNSVWQDKLFLSKYMPSIVAYLNYRIIDVTTVKELARAWYPQDLQVDFKKPENHRALEDIQESINELKHFRTHFFK